MSRKSKPETSATQDDLAVYLRRSHLTLFEAACLVHGDDPGKSTAFAWDCYQSRHPETSGTTAAGRMALIDTLAPLLLGQVGETLGKLKIITGQKINSSMPVAELSEYLADIGLNLPPMVGVHTPAPAAKLPSENINRSKRGRHDGMNIAMEAGYKAMREKNGVDPSARDLFDYLADNDETDKIRTGEKDDCLTYRTEAGESKDVKFKEFQNRLTRLRRRINPQ